MSEFERKLGVGPSHCIETNDAEMLCLLRALDSRRESQTALERERDELRKTLQATQGSETEAIKNVMLMQEEISRLDKESQSLSDQLGACDRQRLDWLKRALTAEAEIARRDAAAAEPVAVLYRNGDVLTKAECGEYFEICCKVETPLYTAAPPAVLPPDVAEAVTRLGECYFRRWVATYKNPAEPEGYVAGNIRVSDLVKLFNFAKSATQQMVVELPIPFDVTINLTRTIGDIEYSYHEYGENFDRDEVLAALDAANVKWEVKK